MPIRLAKAIVKGLAQFLLALGFMPVAAAAAPAELVRAPFVGCASDGQIGPQPAPQTAKVPRLPAALASQLAYYSSQEGPSVLAPRGWHCFGLYGSDGSVLIVTPRVLRAQDFFTDQPIRLSGPAVVSSFSYGGTSGRFTVWSAIARYFPKYGQLIDRQDWEELNGGTLPNSPYPADVILKHSARSIRLVTPSKFDGQGTAGYLSRGPLSVNSLRQLMGTGDETSLLAIDVRLSIAQGHLVDVILANPGGNQ